MASGKFWFSQHCQFKLKFVKTFSQNCQCGPTIKRTKYWFQKFHFPKHVIKEGHKKTKLEAWRFKVYVNPTTLASGIVWLVQNCDWEWRTSVPTKKLKEIKSYSFTSFPAYYTADCETVGSYWEFACHIVNSYCEFLL